MQIYHLSLTLQDPVYFATRELGRFYVTENHIHNYALTYALGLAKSSYHDAEHVPHYQQDLEPLNNQGIYVTPARPVDFAYVTHTYKWADLRYHVQMEKSSVNLPTFGRIRELAPESYFESYLITSNPIQIPRWIRIGKWMSKVKIKSTTISSFNENEGSFTCRFVLNPMDVISSYDIISYDVINMPPVSLIKNAKLQGKYYKIDQDRDISIPANMNYCFNI